MKKVMVIAVLSTALAGCVADTRNLSVDSMLPDDALYYQIVPAKRLAGAFTVGDITFDDNKHIEVERESMKNWTRDMNLALSRALEKAGYLSKTEKAARYIVSGSIKDFDLPNCLYASCDGGSAIEYTIANQKTGVAVFSQLIVVPYTKAVPFALDIQPEVMWKHSGKQLGENIAHFVHLIGTLPPSQLK